MNTSITDAFSPSIQMAVPGLVSGHEVNRDGGRPQYDCPGGGPWTTTQTPNRRPVKDHRTLDAASWAAVTVASSNDDVSPHHSIGHASQTEDGSGRAISQFTQGVGAT
jgi:hypothetical protein